jgi:hypothetical protein
MDVRSVDLDAELSAEISAALRHQFRWPEHLPSLLFSRRAAVDLGAVLLVCGEHVETDASAQCAFAILAGHDDIGLAEPALAVILADESEDVDENKALPRLKDDQLAVAGPFPLGVG